MPRAREGTFSASTSRGRPRPFGSHAICEHLLVGYYLSGPRRNHLRPERYCEPLKQAQEPRGTASVRSGRLQFSSCEQRNGVSGQRVKKQPLTYSTSSVAFRLCCLFLLWSSRRFCVHLWGVPLPVLTFVLVPHRQRLWQHDKPSYGQVSLTSTAEASRRPSHENSFCIALRPESSIIHVICHDKATERTSSRARACREKTGEGESRPQTDFACPSLSFLLEGYWTGTKSHGRYPVFLQPPERSGQ